MSASLPADILQLSVSERIQLAQDIWDSIAAESGAIPLTDAQREEIDERLAEGQAHRAAGTPWAEVKARLLGSS
jgi:putative addiction module component (TIGR02574 family)